MGFRALLLSLVAVFSVAEEGVPTSLPDTGISGVYEVIVGVKNSKEAIDYFDLFGFKVVSEAALSRAEAETLYGVPSAAKSYRLQNGKIDAHGLLRLIEWQQPTGPGVGFAHPETVGFRVAVMRTEDIFRLADIYTDLRQKAEQPWLVAGPVYDDLYDSTDGKPSMFNRRVGVREMGAYGGWFNHIFFQRYGYTIPGYGTVGDHAPLRTSEFTHHDFVVKGDLAEVTEYYSSVLGFRAENDPVIDGEWQHGPKAIFQMRPGDSHWYRGFVSPNDVSGKLKFFSLEGIRTADDRSARQRPGELGITLHSLWTPTLSKVHALAQDHGLSPTAIARNEFGEKSFLMRGPDGVSWQIIQRAGAKNSAVTKFEFQKVNN